LRQNPGPADFFYARFAGLGNPKRKAQVRGAFAVKLSVPKINFILRQSDEDLACFTIHDSRTLLKLFLDEQDLKSLADEVADARIHLRQSRNLSELVARNLKHTRFPRGKGTRR
jgi:hypothetical protein